jgi:hypothetical protein
MDLIKVTKELKLVSANLPEKLDEKHLVGISKNYVENVKILKTIEDFVNNAKSYLLQVVDKFGNADGNHKILNINGFTIKDQVALRKSPTNEAASYLFKKGFRDVITTKNVINLKAGVNPDNIPKDVLDTLNKYFDIVVEKEVDKDAIELLLKNGKITQEEYDNLIEVKKTHTLKVSE